MWLAGQGKIEKLVPYEGVEVLTGAKVTGYQGGKLSVTAADKEKELACDSVVLAVGYQEDSLYHQLEFDIPEI